ncbi:MAG: hypothetical protein ACQUYJ_14975, partial [Ferruginibacter sp.]
METKKMSLANMQGKMSRTEMKNIMAGSGSACAPNGQSCPDKYGTPDGCCGKCVKSSLGFYSCGPK